jgi:hypothetical protein
MWVNEGSMRFQTQNLVPGDTIQQEVGDSDCPPAGWLLAYASTTTTQPPAALEQTLDVNLQVSGPGPAGLAGILVESWSPGPVGLLYIPWPKINIQVSADPALPGNATWRLNAMPVLDSSAAAGLPSAVITETPIDLVPNAEVTIPFPRGATDWAIWPDSATTMRIQPQDVTAAAVRGQWDINPGPVAAGGTPAMSWQPTFRNGQVRVVDSGAAGVRATMFFRYDFRTYGDSA